MGKFKKRLKSVLTAGVAFLASAAIGVSLWKQPQAKGSTEQIHNGRIQSISAPTQEQYNENWDWKKTAENYLRYVFDTRNDYQADNGDHGGFMYAERSRKIGRFVDSKNMDDYFGDESGENQAWGMASYIAYNMNDAELGEGITNLAAIASAALIGLENLNDYQLYNEDGTPLAKYNFVKSAVAHYNRYDHIVSNGDDGSGRSGQDEFWYELLPNVLFTIIANEYSDIEYVEENGERNYYLRDIVTESARNRLKAVVGMGGVNANFDHKGYDINLDAPIDNSGQRNADSAAGFAYILYSAYKMNEALPVDERLATEAEMENFLLGAKWSMDYLERIDFSPFYEVLVYLAPYMAARMNAEEGTNYNVAKMYHWAFSDSAVRGGWGMINENWNGFYTQGLMGSTTDTGGYAFAMNTFDTVLGFVPMVRYDARFAEDIAKWMTCASQSAQNFYPAGLDYSDNYAVDGSVYGGETNGYYGNDVYNGFYQSGKWIQKDTEPEYWTGEAGVKMSSFIPYEGLRRYRKKVVYNSSASSSRASANDTNYGPYASGDAYTYNWNGHTDYGMYGGAHVGIFASVIEKTNVSRILEIDLSKLDVFADNQTTDGKEIAFKMYYNPYSESKTVTIDCENGVTLFDTVTKTTVGSATGAGKASVTLEAGQTVALAFIPQGKTVSAAGGVYTCDGVFLAQEKGSVSLALYGAETGGSAIRSGATVKDTVYAELGAIAPEGGEISSLTLSFAGTVIGTYDALPTGRVAIDTTALKNTTGGVRLTVDFGGSKESVEISVTVDNRTPTYDIVDYQSDADLAAKWTAATSEWNEAHPESEHYGNVTAKGDDGDGITVSLPSNLSAGKDYAWVTSELFTVDFSRQPVLKFSVDSATAKYSVKIFIEGIEKKSDAYTGKYLIANSASAVGEVIYNLPDDLPSEIVKDENFDPTGVYRVSVKIAAVGGVGDSVDISGFTVYHGSGKPSPVAPDSYEWGYEFSAAHIYNFDASAHGNATLVYEKGVTKISADEESGVASPYLSVFSARNPSVTLKPVSLTGTYFIAVQLEGYDGNIYYLRRNISSAEPLSLSVSEEMDRLYPGTFDQDVRVRVLIGVDEDSVLEMGKLLTYYALPEWGVQITGTAASEWENLAGASARATVTLDLGGRAVFVNRAESDNETAIAGRRSAFSVDLDRNPYFSITVRNATGDWRLTLITVQDGTVYELIGWNGEFGRDGVVVALSDKLDGALTGEQSVYLALELRGGGTTVTLQSIETYYQTVQPVFGGSYSSGAATWLPETNAPELFVENGDLRIRSNGLGEKYILSPSLRVKGNTTPIVGVSLLDVQETDGVFVTAFIGENSYALSGAGIFSSGEYSFDLRAITGFNRARAFTMRLAIGASGEEFSFLLDEVSFKYRLDAPSGLVVSDENELKWDGSDEVEKYAFAIYNASGDAVKSGKTIFNELALSDMGLSQGIYTAVITATSNGFVDSASAKISFKVGDIATVTLGKAKISLNGVKVVWSEVVNATQYAYKLVDAESGETVVEGVTAERALDLSTFGFTAFNYRMEVKALGDGTVFVDGATTTFSFYTADVARYTATGFPAMTRGQNNAVATYDSAVGASAITVPDNGNWGNVQSPEFTLDFDKTPVLVVVFGENNVGGYHLSIVLDGVTYNLCDDTYDYGSGTLYMDINAALESRNGPPYYDGPQTAVKGKHTVQILFGVTMGESSGTPKVYYKSATVYEMTEGQGVKTVGQLARAAVSVSNGKAVWDAVDNAQEYLVTVSNEFGVLISEKVTATEYDLSFLKREGDYSVQVTASGAGYYDSNASVRLFRITEEKPRKATFKESLGMNKTAVIVVSSVTLALSLGGIFVGLLFMKKRR
ncbi:MAG: hypothetical protein IJY62_05425 [Clostridia bacterium]|nr:hypothetical protein [Clostridia bacterium]